VVFADSEHIQPDLVGLLDPLPGKVKKDRKKELLVERAQADFGAWLAAEALVAAA